MSVAAMTWAWEQSLQPAAKLVLMALADDADDSGACWPRVKRLAEKSSASVRTVQRHLRALAGQGLIREEEKFREDGTRAANLYHLLLNQAVLPLKVDGVILSPPGVKLAPSPVRLSPSPGVILSPPGVKLSGDKRLLEVDSKAFKTSPLNTTPPMGAGFDTFWEHYPKKKSKGQARKAWKELKPNEQLRAKILEALGRATTSVEWTKEGGEFIPYPASWLRAEGWDDEFRQPRHLQVRATSSTAEVVPAHGEEMMDPEEISKLSGQVVRSMRSV